MTIKIIGIRPTIQKIAASRLDKVKIFFFNLPSPSGRAVAPGVHSAFDRNEYQKQKNVSGE
jgi:hypothetical protein